MVITQAVTRIVLVALFIVVATACTSDEAGDPEVGGSTPSTRPTPTAECLSTGEAVLDALRVVTDDHRDLSPERFVRRYGSSPSLASQLDISEGDIRCDQPTAFAIAIERSGDISQESPGALLAKGLLLAEMGARLSYGQDIGPLTPVVAPLPVEAPQAPSGAAIEDAGSCQEVATAHASVFQATLDAIAGLTLEQFFGVEPGAEDIQEGSLGALEAVEPALERLECDAQAYYETLLSRMTTLETRGFTDNAALGTFVADVYTQFAGVE